MRPRYFPGEFLLGRICRENKDYQKILDLDPDTSRDEIKRAYRKLVHKDHPDVNSGPDAAGAERKFKDIGETYAVLQDPEKREACDQVGANGHEGQAFRPSPEPELDPGGHTFVRETTVNCFEELRFAE